MPTLLPGEQPRCLARRRRRRCSFRQKLLDSREDVPYRPALQVIRIEECEFPPCLTLRSGNAPNSDQRNVAVFLVPTDWCRVPVVHPLAHVNESLRVCVPAQVEPVFQAIDPVCCLEVCDGSTAPQNPATMSSIGSTTKRRACATVSSPAAFATRSVKPLCSLEKLVEALIGRRFSYPRQKTPAQRKSADERT